MKGAKVHEKEVLNSFVYFVYFVVPFFSNALTTKGTKRHERNVRSVFVFFVYFGAILFPVIPRSLRYLPSGSC